MKIGVFGPKGRLGSTLVAMGCDPLDCDITVEEQVKDAVRSVRPDVLINAAAFTSVDAAELPENQKELISTNVSAMRWLYKNSGAACLIHISTDYVFGGRRGPYTEKMNFIKNDLPKSEYGKSKMAGEAYLRFLPDVTIVRTTGLFGIGDDFLSYLIKTVGRGERVAVTDTLIANQTYIPFLARDLIQLANMKYNYRPPIIHLASQDVMSRYDFSILISRYADFDIHFLLPAKSSEIDGWIAERPVKGGLSTKYAQSLGFPAYTVEEGLQAYFENHNRYPIL